MNSIGNQLFQNRQTSLCFAVVVVLSAFILPTTYARNDAPASYGTTSSSGSGESLLPCSYRRTIILHGHLLEVDECTTCGCDNSSVSCDIMPCPSIFCDEPMFLTDVCCDICPYYVPVWKVTPDTLYVISEDQINHIEFDLTVAINGAGVGVTGEGLWKVGVWASRRADGKGNRIGYTKQILSQEQAATTLTRPNFFGGYEFNIPDIKYSLNAKNTTCSDMQYLCVEFAKGDDPSPQEPRVPFTVEGVRNDFKLRSTPRNLQGCRPFPGCKDNAYNDIIQTQIGQSVVLPCNETLPTPQPYITQWKHTVIGFIYVSFGGAPPYIHEQYNRRVSLVDSKSLKIDDVRPEDEGWYECQIVLLDGDLSNTQNSSLSHLIVIDVPSTQASTTYELTTASTTHEVSTHKVSGEIVASASYGTTSRSGSSESLLPCRYRGAIILHGDQLRVDECVTCGCDNSTVRCDIMPCPSIFCDEPIFLTDVCCDRCPHYVPVWKVTPDTLFIISEEQRNPIEFDLTVSINGAGDGVTGEGLWKVGVWASRRADGKGKRIAYKKQILSQEQAATTLTRPNFFGGYEFNIPDIKYSLNAKKTTCSDMQYLCVEFAKGDDPSLKEPRVPFTVKGVRNEDKLRSTPRNLQGCRPFPGCKDSYGEVVY